MKKEETKKVTGWRLNMPPRDRMMRPRETRRATTADILPRNLTVPGSRPRLVESDDQ